MERWRRPARAREQMATNSASSSRRSISAQGRVLEAGELFEESKPKQRSLALKASDHFLIDILDYAQKRNIIFQKIRGGVPKLA